PYDAGRAQQGLTDAGWARGTDGTLVHRTTGERFETQAWASRPDEEKIVLVAADYWKTLGGQIEPYVVPPALSGDRAYAATYTGVRTDGSPSVVHYDGGKLHSVAIRSAANNFTGSNRAGYNNPRVDALIDRLSRSIDPGEQLSAHGDLLHEVTTDIAFM